MDSTEGVEDADEQLGVREDVLVDAPRHEVWRTLVDADRRRRWWSYLELDPVVGGRFTERWTGAAGEAVVTAGSVLELDEDRLLRLTWSDDDWSAQTEVEITLSPTPAGTRVTVRHSGFERLRDGRHLAGEHREGWRTHLSNLRSAVEDRCAS